jgi:hypothetical protein
MFDTELCFIHPNGVPVKKYVFIFAFSYLILAGVVELLELKGGAGFNFTTLLMASFCAAWRFTKDQGRLPTSDELKSYSWLALFSVWLMSLLAAGAFLFLFSTAEINGLLKFIASMKFFFVAGVIIISLIYYVTIRWSFSWYARKVFQ